MPERSHAPRTDDADLTEATWKGLIMPNRPDRRARSTLAIPHRPAPRLTTHDAKDPDTRYPPIEALLLSFVNNVSGNHILAAA